jgi:hypothetical protein
VQLLRQPGEVAESRREAAEGDGELGGRQRLDERGKPKAGEPRDVGQVRPVEDDRKVHCRDVAGRGGFRQGQPPQDGDVGVGRRAVEDDEHRARGRDQFPLAGQRRALEGSADGRDGGQVLDLGQQRPVTVRKHAHRRTRCSVLLHASMIGGGPGLWPAGSQVRRLPAVHRRHRRGRSPEGEFVGGHRTAGVQQVIRSGRSDNGA